MTTALQLITGAARLLQVVRKGEPLDADEAMDGLNALNDMLESWGNSSLMVTARAWETFNIAAASSYSIGASQTLNTTRPTIIRKAFIRLANGDYDLEPLSDERYEDIFLKSLSTNIPEYISIDNGYPYGTIRLYPLLNTSAELHLLSEKPLTSIATLNTVIDLAPGWKRALRFNLAIELAGEYGVQIPMQVGTIAGQAKREIALSVAKNRQIQLNQPFDVKPNIYSGIA